MSDPLLVRFNVTAWVMICPWVMLCTWVMVCTWVILSLTLFFERLSRIIFHTIEKPYETNKNIPGHGDHESSIDWTHIRSIMLNSQSTLFILTSRKLES